MIFRRVISFVTPRGGFAKLVTGFLVIGLVPFLGMELWTYDTAEERMTETVIEYWLVRLAREAAVQLDDEVLRMRDLVGGWAQDEVLARDVPLSTSAETPEREPALARLENYLYNRHKTRRDQIDYMLVVARDGAILADSLAPEDPHGAWRSPLSGMKLDKVVPTTDRISSITD